MKNVALIFKLIDKRFTKNIHNGANKIVICRFSYIGQLEIVHLYINFHKIDTIIGCKIMNVIFDLVCVIYF